MSGDNPVAFPVLLIGNTGRPSNLVFSREARGAGAEDGVWFRPDVRGLGLYLSGLVETRRAPTSVFAGPYL